MASDILKSVHSRYFQKVESEDHPASQQQLKMGMRDDKSTKQYNLSGCSVCITDGRNL